jgi:hypothetical protein
MRKTLKQRTTTKTKMVVESLILKALIYPRSVANSLRTNAIPVYPSHLHFYRNESKHLVSAYLVR